MYFYNYELTYSDYNINTKESTTPNYSYIDNFNEYFNIYSLENFNKNINRTLKDLYISTGFIQSGSDLLTVTPTFSTINDCLYYYIQEVLQR